MVVLFQQFLSSAQSHTVMCIKCRKLAVCFCAGEPGSNLKVNIFFVNIKNVEQFSKGPGWNLTQTAVVRTQP